MSNEQKTPRQLSKRAQTARYVVSVDHQAKSSYDTLAAAKAEAKRISDAFPVLAVEVSDSENDSLKLLQEAQAETVAGDTEDPAPE